MKKVFYVLLSVLFLSCSDDNDEKDTRILDNYKTVKIIFTRTSNNYSLFFGGTILTIPQDKLNSKYDSKDFDSVLENEGKLLLGKINEPISSKQEFTLKQKIVNIQVLDTPQLRDEIDGDADSFNLTTKIDIFVDNDLVKSQSFIFDTALSNLNLVHYSNKQP